MAANEPDVWSFSNPDQRVQWPYNKWYKAHIKKRIQYAFVRQLWDRDLLEVASLERLQDEPHDPVYVPLNEGDHATLKDIHQAGIATLMQLLDMVATKENAEVFCQKAGVDPDPLKDLLRKIYKYLPAGAQMRQLVAKEDATTQRYIDKLIEHKLGFSLALLDQGATKKDREELSKLTGIPEGALLDLVKRADMTRLGLMGGGMIRLSWALGYKGLAAYTDVTPEEYFTSCQNYYQQAGKGIAFDFTMKNVISHLERLKQATSMIAY